MMALLSVTDDGVLSVIGVSMIEWANNEMIFFLFVSVCSE